MKKVKMLKATNYNKPLDVGDEIEVSDKVAIRWDTKDIAKILEPPKTEEPAKIDWEEEIKQYHKGGGYYDIPGVEDTVKGKEEAIKALKG